MIATRSQRGRDRRDRVKGAQQYSIAPPRIAPDGKAYVYSYNRILPDLFLAEGIR